MIFVPRRLTSLAQRQENFNKAALRPWLRTYANMGREDLVKPTSEPYQRVEPLGHSRLWGPGRDEHIVLVLGVS